MSMSKYEGMTNATKNIVDALDESIDDKIKIQSLKSQLDLIDEVASQEIDAIKSTPINKELLDQEAQANYDSKIKFNLRQKLSVIQNAENAISQAEFDRDYTIRQAELRVKEAKDKLSQVKELALEREASENLIAKQEFERVKASIGDVDKTINLQIEKVRINAKNKARATKLELDTITAKIAAHSEKIARQEKLYTDMVNIGLALGDKAK